MTNKLLITVAAAAISLLGLSGCDSSSDEDATTPAVVEDAADESEGTMEEAGKAVDEVLEEAGDAVEELVDDAVDAVEEATGDEEG